MVVTLGAGADEAGIAAAGFLHQDRIGVAGGADSVVGRDFLRGDAGEVGSLAGFVKVPTRHKDCS